MPEARVNGSFSKRLPNTLNIILPDIRGESLVIAMDRHGISLSSGSACNAGSPLPTHVLLNMGITEEEAHCAVRFSLSVYTTEKDIDDTIETLIEVIKELKDTANRLACK